MKRMTAVLAVVAALVIIYGASVTKADELTFDTWPTTVYYLALLSGPNTPYEDITVDITAVDEYTLYVNGIEIGSDDDWSTVDSWPVSIDGSDICIGVEVKNNGIGNGYGLMVDIVAGDDRLGTSTKRRYTELRDELEVTYFSQWYYCSVEAGADFRENWFDVDSEYFQQQVLIDGYKWVQKGVLNISETGFDADLHTEVIAGYPANNVDTGFVNGSGIMLRPLDGDNLALKKAAEYYACVDGICKSVNNSDFPDELSGFVDLEEIHLVNQVTLYVEYDEAITGDSENIPFFAIDLSLDGFRYEEVGALYDNELMGKNELDITFPVEWARYVRFRTKHMGTFPVEIAVYGVGYAYEGVYESNWIDFGSPDALKTLTNIQWEGEIPEGTGISVQIQIRRKIGDGEYETFDWLDPSYETAFDVVDLVPCHEVRYRVRLETQDVDISPAFHSITLTYVDDITEADAGDDLPVALAITGAYPNPFNGAVTVEYALPDAGRAAIDVYNLAGQRVYHHDIGHTSAGRGEFVWDGRDSSGSGVSAGTYIFRLSAGNAIANAKVLYLK